MTYFFDLDNITWTWHTKWVLPYEPKRKSIRRAYWRITKTNRCSRRLFPYLNAFDHLSRWRRRLRGTFWSDVPTDYDISRCPPYRRPWTKRLDLRKKREVTKSTQTISIGGRSKSQCVVPDVPKANKWKREGCLCLLSKCSMLNPIVGTEMDFRSSLFLKKFTIVDLPELLRPMIRMLICFGFRSLFKIFINNFSKTIFSASCFFLCSKQVFWNVYFGIDENFSFMFRWKY